jgi:hypothetical protein
MKMKNLNIFLKYFELFLFLTILVNLLAIQFLTSGGLKAFITDDYSSYERIAILSAVESMVYAVIYTMAEIYESRNRKGKSS